MAKPQPQVALTVELLQTEPQTLDEFVTWIGRVIEGWRVNMRGHVSAGRASWPRDQLLECVKLAGLHADRFDLGVDAFGEPAAPGAFGRESLLKRRPSLFAADDIEVLEYLRLCERTAAVRIQQQRTDKEKQRRRAEPATATKASRSSHRASDGLTRTATAVLAIIKAQPAGTGIIGKDIVTALKEKKIKIAYSTLRRHVLPVLIEKHGVVNHPAAGGYLVP